MKNKLYTAISSKLNAMDNCEKSGNHEWFHNHYNDVVKLVSDHMPHGSGIDSGVELNFEASKSEKLVFTFDYHHMNEDGYYNGWTEHKAIITPSLQFGYNLRIMGSNRNGDIDYFTDVFSEALNAEVDA